MEANGEDFSRFIWSFVDDEPKINHWWCLAEAPATTAVSDAMSKALKNADLNSLDRRFVMLLCRPAVGERSHGKLFCHPDNAVK